MVTSTTEHLVGSCCRAALRATPSCSARRIITVADVVRASSTYRPYRPGPGTGATGATEINASRPLTDGTERRLPPGLFREQGLRLAERPDPDIWRVKS